MITIEQALALIGHTDGPWRIRVNKRDGQDECDLSICGDIFILAELNGPQYLHQRPNARLIAAAPDLLELIRSLADENKRLRAALTYYAEGHSQNPNEGPWGMASTDFGQLAREALKETKS